MLFTFFTRLNCVFVYFVAFFRQIYNKTYRIFSSAIFNETSGRFREMSIVRKTDCISFSELYTKRCYWLI